MSGRSSTATRPATRRSSLTRPPSFSAMSGDCPRTCLVQRWLCGGADLSSGFFGHGWGLSPDAAEKDRGSSELADVGEVAGDGGGGGHRGADEVRAAAGALAALEVPV